MSERMKWPLRTNETREGQGPLKVAIERQSVKDVLALVENGAPVLAEFHLDDLGKDTGNALDLLVLHKRYALVLQLLKLEEPSGVELAKTCRRALAWSAREGKFAILQQLIVHGAGVTQQDEQGRSALLLAAMRGHHACVQLLLDADAMAQEKDAIEVQKWLEHFKMQNQSKLKDSAESEQQVIESQEVPASIATAPGTDLEGPLYRAITRHGVKEVKDLVRRGAPVCAMYPLNELGTEMGTALDLAVLEKRYELSQYLMKEQVSGCGADLVLASVRAVAWIARDGKDQLLQELLRFGADANQCDEQGRSALHLAVLRGQKNCALTLLEAGAWEKELQRDEVRNLADHWKFDANFFPDTPEMGFACEG